MRIFRYIYSVLFLCLTLALTAQIYVVTPINVQGLDTVTYVPPSPGADLAILHYFFENNAADSSGNARDATVSGMVYGTSSPAEGTYYGDFTTTTTRLFNIPTGYILTSPHSFSMWVRQQNTGGYYELLDPHATATWEYWEFWLDGVLFDIEFRGYQSSTNTMDRAGTPDATWSAGTDWMHIVWTYNDGTVYIYLNGTSVSNTTSTWSTSDMKLNTTLYIGQYAEADIDDFSLYDFILTQTQVTTLYNSGVAGKVLTE